MDRDELRRQADYPELLLALDMAQAKLEQAEQSWQRSPVIRARRRRCWRRRPRRCGTRWLVSEAVHREEAVLEQIEGGAYSAVAAAEEELAELEAKLARERLAAEAIKLLHDTLAR